MNRVKKTWKYTLGLTLGLAFAMTVVPVGAEEDAEGTPEEQEKDCAAAVKKCDVASVASAYSTMRQECSEFRQCKRGCGDERKSCKESARLDKRDCGDTCKSKSGKAKRDCKESCRKEKKAAKQACRQAKRTCNTSCVKELKSKGCIKARNDFWGSFVGSARDCAVDTKDNCEAPFPKKD